MTEIGFFRNNKKKTNKISQISYFFPTLFLVHRKVRCPPKVPPKPTSIHISGLARPQGRPKKKKILSKIYLKALKDRYGCQDTIISKCIFFHMLEISGSLRAIVTKLSQPLVLMASLFFQSLKIFGPVEPEI